MIDALSSVIGSEMPDNTFLPLGGSAATEALLAGEIDAAIYVAPVSAPYLQPLFVDDDVTAVAIRDGAAIARQLSFVRQVTIPRSGFDYASERPPEDIAMIAMIGALVASADLHPGAG